MENRAEQSEQDVGQRFFMWFPGTTSVALHRQLFSK